RTNPQVTLIKLAPDAGATVNTDQGTYAISFGSTDGQAKTLKLLNGAFAVNLKPGMLVTGPGITGVVRVATIEPDPNDSAATLIKLSLDEGATVATAQGSYTFSGAVNDYASVRLLDLWYAWSDYYFLYVKGQKPFGGANSMDIPGGTIAAGS